MNDARFLRCDTILSHLAKQDTQVTVVTAKHKLLDLVPSVQMLAMLLAAQLLSSSAQLSSGLPSSAVKFSVEKIDQAAAVNHRISDVLSALDRPIPSIYSPDATLFCLEAGLRLLYIERKTQLDRFKAEWHGNSLKPHHVHRSGVPHSIPPIELFGGRSFYYLTTTDYVQHKYSPGSVEANSFYAGIDRILGGFHELGAVVGVTSDHGMNDKVHIAIFAHPDPCLLTCVIAVSPQTRYDGSPAVVYLESTLQAAGFSSRVILPITDPYVVHHGALGSFATVYLDAPPSKVAEPPASELSHPTHLHVPTRVDKHRLHAAMSLLRKLPGVYTVLDNHEASKAFDLPSDRIGDIVVIGDEHTALGRSPEFHDLSQVPHLRSHGGLSETTVPLLINRPLKAEYSKALTRGTLRNFSLFDILLNGVIDDRKVHQEWP